MIICIASFAIRHRGAYSATKITTQFIFNIKYTVLMNFLYQSVMIFSLVVHFPLHFLHCQMNSGTDAVSSNYETTFQRKMCIVTVDNSLHNFEYKYIFLWSKVRHFDVEFMSGKLSC